MESLSVHIFEDSIVIQEDSKPVGRLMKDWLHPVGFEAFLKANYNVQGSVGYQTWLSGVLAGAVLIIGPPSLPSEDEFVTAGSETAQVDQLGGLTPSRSPETIVPSAESPAAVGETIVPVSESPAVASEETRGLTPPGSPVAGTPESDAAGAVSP